MDGEQLVAFIGIGLLLSTLILLPAYLAYRRDERLRATGKKVRGVVVNTSFRFGRSSGYHSTVRFVTQTGQVIQADYSKNLSLRLIAGQSVWVVYEESNPYNFVL